MEGQLLVCLCFRNGCVYSTMAALLNSGDHCFFSSVLGDTFLVYQLFSKWNIQTSYFDINKPETIEASSLILILLLNHTNVVDIIDLELLGKLLKSTI
jgi:O-succinylhomoserine sulfhydrylase